MKKNTQTLHIYTLYNKKTELYNTPVVSLDREMFITDITLLGKQIRHNYINTQYKHLIAAELGTFNLVSGIIRTHRKPEHFQALAEINFKPTWKEKYLQIIETQKLEIEKLQKELADGKKTKKQNN